MFEIASQSNFDYVGIQRSAIGKPSVTCNWKGVDNGYIYLSLIYLGRMLNGNGAIFH